MTPKKLQTQSKYNEFDLDGDGVVTDEEIARSKEMVDLELREREVRSTKDDGVVGNTGNDCCNSCVIYAFYTRQPSKCFVGTAWSILLFTLRYCRYIHGCDGIHAQTF